MMSYLAHKLATAHKSPPWVLAAQPLFSLPTNSKGGLIEDGCFLKKEPVDGYESGPTIHHYYFI